jgi:hypothetical protein
MSNIDKAFKTKAQARGLRFAVGGMIDPDEGQPGVQPQLQGPEVRNTFGNDMRLTNYFQQGLDRIRNDQEYAERQATEPALSASPQSAQSPFSGALRRLDSQIGNLDALSSLSNTERYQLANPGNRPYKPGRSFGSAAEASALGQRRGILGALRNNLLDQEAEWGLARGGVVWPGKRKPCGLRDGGVVRVSGPGTGTSDDIPLRVTGGGRGLRAHVSDGEALAVLPARTANDPWAVAAVNGIIEATNGQAPKGLRDQGRYAAGAVPGNEASDEEIRRWADAELAARQAPKQAAVPTPVQAAAPVQAPAPEPAPAAAPAQTQGVLRDNAVRPKFLPIFPF